MQVEDVIHVMSQTGVVELTRRERLYTFAQEIIIAEQCDLLNAQKEALQAFARACFDRCEAWNADYWQAMNQRRELDALRLYERRDEAHECKQLARSMINTHMIIR
jgi:hypothetical protein